MGERLTQLRRWLTEEAGLADFALEPASGDASFRRYFRIRTADRCLIAVDAPPAQEDSTPFLRVAGLLLEWGLHVPEILESDLRQGFMLLSDLGTRLYLDALGEATVERLYGDALAALAVLQARGAEGVHLVPPYDELLLRQELELFRDWYLVRHRGLSLSAGQHAVLMHTFDGLVANAGEQPRVFVHRDYHSRNLMVTASNNPGILDFQDAVHGPVTYDLASLLRDCYIAWPAERVDEWALGYHQLALQSGILRERSAERFLRWFDLMGVQRHLKATGIFARLNHRDGKPAYLGDIPRTLGYVAAVSARHAELRGFAALLADLGVWDRP